MNFGDKGQEQFDQMMETAVFSAATSEDGAMMLANVITKSDVDTAGAMLDNIKTVAANDPYSTLAAEVLSEVATTAIATNTYFDAGKMDSFTDLVDTVAYTDTAVDDAAALEVTTAAALAATTDTTTTDTTTTDTTTTDDSLYDAAGFAFAPPYYHKDTGTIYNNAGFDKNGNSSVVDSDVTYDAAGFAFAPPYYHKDTGTMYNNAGFDKFGNSSGGSGEDFDENGFSNLTPFNHNVTGTQFDSGGLHRITRTDRDNLGYNSAGYNSSGYDSAANYNASYDENVSPS